MPAGENVRYYCAGDYKRRILRDSEDQFILRWTFNDSPNLPNNVYGYTYHLWCSLVINKLQESNTGFYKLEFHDILNQYVLYDVAFIALSSMKWSTTTDNSRIDIRSKCT